MTNVYSLDGLLVFALLFVCTCAYFRKVPRLRSWLLSEKKGVWGVFYKASGTQQKHSLNKENICCLHLLWTVHLLLGRNHISAILLVTCSQCL
uniref:Protein kish n=1 Tax=Xenopus tropicalis TaxID=8364 RepID=A0A803K234_XENTR